MQISNEHLSAVWSEDGQLQSLISAHGISPLGAGYSFDLIVDSAPFFGDAARLPVAMETDGLAARVVFESQDLRITHHAALDGDLALLRQRVEIEVLAGSPRRLTAVHWRVPELLVAKPQECFLQAPAQVTLPDFPYLEAARLPLDRSHSEPLPSYPQGWLQSAPDETTGLVAVENRALRQVVSVWQHSQAATTFPTLHGDGETIRVEHRHQIAAWLRPGAHVVSDGHAILLSHGTLEEHLAQFRKLAYDGKLNRVGAAPQWLREARLLQIVPQTGVNWTPHLDGAPIAVWTQRLDQIQKLGFNLIYLLPVWQCHEGMGYALTDHYQINPEVGTAAQLKTFVREAHARGLKVLFDFIPQGIGDGAEAFIAAHPDWLVRDELGRPFGSHGWGPKPGQPPVGHTYSLDWGRADVRRFMVEWALSNVREFDCDGFRTDALHWKEPNFAPDNPHPAWQTTFGGIKLGEELHAALQAEKPEAVLLSEVWGPIEAGLPPTGTKGWFETLELRDARSLYRYSDGYFAGEAAACVHQFGQGAAFYLGARIERAALTELMREVLKTAKIETVCEVPQGGQLVQRGEVVFLTNHSDQELTFSLPYAMCVLMGAAPCGSKLTLSPFGFAVVQKAHDEEKEDVTC